MAAAILRVIKRGANLLLTAVALFTAPGTVIALPLRLAELAAATPLSVLIHALARTPSGPRPPTAWNPVEDARDTQRLKGKMTELGWYCSIFWWAEGDRRTSCKFMKMDASGRSEGPDELRAVCRAAKDAKESE